MTEQNIIPIDMKVMKKAIKSIKITAWILMLAAITGIVLVFSLNVSWWPWRTMIIIAVPIFFFASVINFSGIDQIKAAVYAVEAGETYVPNIMKSVPYSFKEADLRKMIEIGIFPGVTIRENNLILKSIVPELIKKTMHANDVETLEKEVSKQKINLNAATELELTSLPGIGVALAKKAIELRTQGNGFMSVQDFCERLDLMPHFAVQIDSLAFVTPMDEQSQLPDPKGRVIDI